MVSALVFMLLYNFILIKMDLLFLHDQTTFQQAKIFPWSGNLSTYNEFFQKQKIFYDHRNFPQAKIFFTTETFTSIQYLRSEAKIFKPFNAWWSQKVICILEKQQTFKCRFLRKYDLLWPPVIERLNIFYSLTKFPFSASEMNNEIEMSEMSC